MNDEPVWLQAIFILFLGVMLFGAIGAVVVLFAYLWPGLLVLIGLYGVTYLICFLLKKYEIRKKE